MTLDEKIAAIDAELIRRIQRGATAEDLRPLRMARRRLVCIQRTEQRMRRAR